MGWACICDRKLRDTKYVDHAADCLAKAATWRLEYSCLEDNKLPACFHSTLQKAVNESKQLFELSSKGCPQAATPNASARGRRRIRVNKTKASSSDVGEQAAVGDSPARRMGKAAPPEKHLAGLRALLASHGKKLGKGWKVRYNPVNRYRSGVEYLDMDPDFIAPQGFVPDLAKLPARFPSRGYDSRIVVAQAHGVDFGAVGWPAVTAEAPHSNAKLGEAGVVHKSPQMTSGSANHGNASEGIGNNANNKGFEAEEDNEPLIKKRRTTAAAAPACADKAPASSGPQKAGTQASLQLNAVDQTSPKMGPEPVPAPASAAADVAASGSQQAGGLNRPRNTMAECYFYLLNQKGTPPEYLQELHRAAQNNA